MEFPVPQFIDIEEKILGSLTLKQTLYLVGAAGVIFVLYFFVETWLFVILSVIILLIAAAFSFIKIGGRTLGRFINSILIYAFVPHVFIWKKTEVKKVPEKITLTKAEAIIKTGEEEPQRRLGSGLREISKKIDIGVKTKRLEERAKEKNKILPA